MKDIDEQKVRLKNANKLIKKASNTGLFYFYHNTYVSRFTMGKLKRLYLIDCKTRNPIYTHYSGRWKDFSGNKIEELFIRKLRNYIKFGTKLPPDVFDDWRYGLEKNNMVKAAMSLGMINAQERKE